MRDSKNKALLKSVSVILLGSALSSVLLAPAAEARDSGDWFPGNDSEMVNVPGTTDSTFDSRVEPLVGPREHSTVDYVGSMGPITGGNRKGITKFGPLAPSYDDSAAEGTAAVEKSFSDHNSHGGQRQPVIWTGYSQGSEVLGDGAERAADKGEVAEGDRILLLADPRSPWGIHQTATTPAGRAVLGSVGFTPKGARNPADTGDAQVTEVVMKSDPTANTQWDPSRPAESIAVNLVGQAMVHGGASPTNYAYALDPSSVEDAKYYKSVEGNTTYAVVDTPHPFTLAQEKAYHDLGIEYTDEDVDSWEQRWQDYYPISEPTPENAAVPMRPATRQELEQSLPPKDCQPADVSEDERVPLESATQ